MSEETQDHKTRQRPLSPHLQIYKPQFTSVTSILHRMTGAALAVGLFIVTWGLVALAMGAQEFGIFTDFFGSILGQIILAGWSLAFFYHLCSGIRHLIMDTGAALELKSAYKAACAVYIMTVVLTAGAWGIYFMFSTMAG